MNFADRLLKIGLASLFVLVCAVGCDGDGSLECRLFPERCFRPPTLAGDYTGTYGVIELRNEDTVVDTTQEIVWRFTNVTYNMRVVLTSGDDRFFCDCAGDYLLIDSGLYFEETDPNVADHACFPDHNPMGLFEFDQTSLTDTILMTQDLTVGSVRMIKVLKLTLD